MSNPRPKPYRLAEKLLQVRNALGLSQSEMLRRLETEELQAAGRISEFELGQSEPPLLVLLSYARVACVPTEVFIDDEMDLPGNLPGPTDHKALKRQFSPRRKRT